LSEDVTIEEVPQERREALDRVLEESFEGWYLRHSRRTLREIEMVRVAKIQGEAVGLAMLKTLSERIGYVYYIAVVRSRRRKGVGGRLLQDALVYFASRGVGEVYASIEDDNPESLALFGREGFKKTNYGEVSRRYGAMRALDLYRRMVVVPGESLFHRELS
jgi:L-amino acid N-acyltransferase YncA